MVKEWNGAFVHKSEFEQKHPQLVPRKFSGDAQSLQNARPDRTEPPVARLLNQDSFSTAGQGTKCNYSQGNSTWTFYKRYSKI